jgi:hypothetical protein
MTTLTRVVALVLLCAPLAYAQEKPNPSAAEKTGAAEKNAAEEKAPDPRRPVFVSARFDITITDTGVGKPITKTVSLNVSTAGSGSIRTTGVIPGPEPATPGNVQVFAKPTVVPLNVDVKGVNVMANGQIRAQVVVEYQPYIENAPRQPSVITASSMTEFANGVKTLILQAADPLSDRRTTIEVTATILK